VTLSFDLLTLNFCSTSTVRRRNSLQNLSKIVHYAVESQLFENLKFGGWPPPWISNYFIYLTGNWFLKFRSLWAPITHHHVNFQCNWVMRGWIIDNFVNFQRRQALRDAVTFTSDPWAWTFVVCPVSCFQTIYKIWAKSKNPCLSYWWLSTFSPSNFKLGQNP